MLSAHGTKSLYLIRSKQRLVWPCPPHLMDFHLATSTACVHACIETISPLTYISSFGLCAKDVIRAMNLPISVRSGKYEVRKTEIFYTSYGV